jgi:glycosyltransferase involved in cell wall biosynthesis
MNTCKYLLLFHIYSIGQIVFFFLKKKLTLYHQTRGYLADRNKPIVFSMARLDKVKNITGLVEWYGQNKKLRDLVNLVVVAGLLDASQSKDREEIEEINKMHNLIDKYQLKGQIRWIRAQTDRVRNAELYRCIADSKGAFVQVCNNLNSFSFLRRKAAGN